MTLCSFSPGWGGVSEVSGLGFSGIGFLVFWVFCFLVLIFCLDFCASSSVVASSSSYSSSFSNHGAGNVVFMGIDGAVLFPKLIGSKPRVEITNSCLFSNVIR